MSDKWDHVNTAGARAGRLPECGPLSPAEAKAPRCFLWSCCHFTEPKYPTSFKSISFIDTLLLQFTRHSTDSVQLKPQMYKSSFYNFLHNKFWYLQTTFLEALDSVRRFRVYHKMNYRKSVRWSLLCAWHCFMLKTDGSAPRNGFSVSSLCALELYTCNRGLSEIPRTVRQPEGRV